MLGTTCTLQMMHTIQLVFFCPLHVLFKSEHSSHLVITISAGSITILQISQEMHDFSLSMFQQQLLAFVQATHNLTFINTNFVQILFHSEL